MTTKACFGVFAAHFASNSGIYLMLTNIPTYMKDVLKFDIKSVRQYGKHVDFNVWLLQVYFFKNGILSALPYIVFWFFIVASGAMGDKLIRSKKLSRTTVRKIFNTIGTNTGSHFLTMILIGGPIFRFFCKGFLIPMVSLIGLSFVRCDLPYLGVALLVAGLASKSVYFSDPDNLILFRSGFFFI
jgi:ACS family sodium-dependent inorganic phosphate cotransporter-like MFS transporter 5